MDAFLPKPFLLQDLIDIVRELKYTENSESQSFYSHTVSNSGPDAVSPTSVTDPVSPMPVPYSDSISVSKPETGAKIPGEKVVRISLDPTHNLQSNPNPNPEPRATEKEAVQIGMSPQPISQPNSNPNPKPILIPEARKSEKKTVEIRESELSLSLSLV
jgi:hypothetical protein